MNYLPRYKAGTMASKRIYRLAIALAGALATTAALGLPDDRHQAIEIQSQNAVREEKQGLTIYQGDVTISQGSILIRADKVTVHSAGNQVSKIICTGTPAHYQQQLKPGDKPVVARANTIEYLLDQDVINLVTNASLEQDGATLTGERIDYDLKQEIIKARGDASGSQRIRMVIPPNQQKDPSE